MHNTHRGLVRVRETTKWPTVMLNRMLPSPCFTILALTVVSSCQIQCRKVPFWSRYHVYKCSVKWPGCGCRVTASVDLSSSFRVILGLMVAPLTNPLCVFFFFFFIMEFNVTHIHGRLHSAHFAEFCWSFTAMWGWILTPSQCLLFFFFNL